MKILIVLTGGTICTKAISREKITIRSISNDAGLLLIDNYRKTGDTATEFVVSDNFGILSENMSIDKYNRILDFLRSINLSDFDGVIIAHGTDTLGFSAALFSVLLSKTPVPVFFVSSNEPVEYKTANGNLNFKAAVDCIKYGIPAGIYVTYRNISDNKMYLHNAKTLRQADENANFYSSQMQCIDDICIDNAQNYFTKLNLSQNTDFDFLKSDKNLCDCVLIINPYPGLDYSRINTDGISAILHTSYHSGTVCTDGEDKNSILYLAKNFKGMIYILQNEQSDEIYSSLLEIANIDNIKFICGTVEEAYAALLTKYSFEDKNDNIK